MVLLVVASFLYIELKCPNIKKWSGQEVLAIPGANLEPKSNKNNTVQCI